MLQELNKELLISLNSLTQYDIIKKIVIIFSDSPIFFLPLFLASLWIYYTYRKNGKIISSEIHFTKSLLEKENLLFILYSTIIGILISIGIQQIVTIDRPEEALKGVGNLLLNHIPDASFPSDHATVSVAFLTSLFFAGFKKTGLYFSPFVIIMLLSRVIIGVHWPFDILVGAVVGFISSYITFKYLTKVKTINKLNQLIIKILGYIKL